MAARAMNEGADLCECYLISKPSATGGKAEVGEDESGDQGESVL